MIKIDLNKIKKITKGILIGKNIIINYITIDTEKIENKKNSLFIAYKGKKYDSHIFIYKAIKYNVSAILVEYFFKLPNNISQIIVKNTNNALYEISKFIRKKSKAIVVAITGTCGKTTVKEMIVSILNKSKSKLVYTISNNNNIVGVALTLINIKLETKILIVEVGMNKLGEIFESIRIIKPNIILINNIYISHLKYLKNINNIIKAKSEIFFGLLKNSRIIINYINNYWFEWKFIFTNINRIPIFFSLYKNKFVDFFAKKIKIFKLKSQYTLNLLNKKISINLKLPGLHNIYNSISAATIAYVIGIKIIYIKRGLNNFKPIENRLYPIFIKKNKIILNDTYNSNIESIINSLKVLSNLNGYKLLVIGDMDELGNKSIFLHNFVFKKINNFNINRIIIYGYYFKLSIFNLNINNNYIDNEKLLIKKIISIIKNKKKINILFKSSRSTNLTKIVNIIINHFK